MGDKIFRIGFFEGDMLVGVCLAIRQKAKRGPHLLIPGGPIIDWNNEKLVKTFIEGIKKKALEEKVWFVRARPEIPETVVSRKFFKNLGFIPAPMHLHAENTWVLGIAKNEEEILSGMRKTTRYLVRKSLNLGFEIEVSVDPKDARILKRLQDATVERHKFVGFPEALFAAQLETFARGNQACLFICKKGKEVLAAAIVIFYGEYAYYHHSASSSKLKELPFTYFLQWNIIREAKKRGCKYYNFWGIAPTDASRHRFAGVTLFKKGFGGGRVDWLHAHDLIVSPLYWVTFIFETGRRILRGL